jgi:glycosyltransferase involved in cell wall biosynthesis
MRIALYSDMAFCERDGAYFAEEAFALFMTRLADHFEHVVVVGRLDPEQERGHYRLPAGVEFVALPYYEALSRPLDAMRALAGSAKRFWGVLGRVEATWLLGPHPLAVLFALQGLARRRRVVLGVRQDMPKHIRARHPARRDLHAAASALEGVWRALGRRVPVVVVGRDLAVRYRRSSRLLQIFISLVDESEIVSPEQADRPYDGELKVLSVGRLDPEKNPLLLAEVLARLSHADGRWRLLVCGDGTMREPLAERLRELGVADRAELRGYVPMGEPLLSLYRTSHVFLHVSFTEGAPQTLLEAFAAGLPVVATDVGGVAEQVADAALLIPPDDADVAAAELFNVAADGQLRRRLVSAGIERVRTHSATRESRRVADFIKSGR